MSCRTFVLLVSLFCLSPGTTLAADCVSPAEGSPVTLRAQATTTSAPVGTLAQGQKLPLIASLRGWYETRLVNGNQAFAAKRSTRIAACPPVTAASLQTAFEIHAIDVGTGLSVLVRAPDFTLLYDAGSNDDTARGDNNRTIAYLNTLTPKLQRIDHVVLSHPHRDHVELLPDVVERLKPKEVWNSGAYNNICGYRNFLLAIAANASILYHTATQDVGAEQVELDEKTCYGVKQPQQTLTLNHAKRIGDERITLGQNASMTFLYADGSKRSTFNENSLVVRLDLGSKRILFMGDAEAGGRKPPGQDPANTSIEGKLLACCVADLKADVLVVGHHGSKTSSRKKFLNAVGAKTFVVSAGPTKYATVVLPDAEIITELESRGKVLRTDLEDDACTTSPDKIGPNADGNAGGCDNVILTITTNGTIFADYRRAAD